MVVKMNKNQTNNRILNNKKRAYGTLTYEDLKNAYNYFEKKCPYSDTQIDENNWHLEHIIPVSMGGTTDSWNCIPVCGPCNLSKGDKHLLDWWDETHSIEEEYKISKMFNYMLTELEKERNMKKGILFIVGALLLIVCIYFGVLFLILSM